MSGLQFSVGKNKTKTKIGSEVSAPINPKAAKAFVKREEEFFRQKQNVEAIGGQEWTRGQWVETDPEKDRRVAELNQLLRSEKAKININPDVLLEYQREKEEEASQKRLFLLASHYADPGRPETQAFAMSMVPELEEVPIKRRDQLIIENAALWNLCFYGDINSKEDFAFVLRVLHDSYVLPLAPAWDCLGIVSEVYNMGTYDERPFFEGRPLFRIEGRHPQKAEGVRKTKQRYIKYRIVKRMFPSLQALPIVTAAQFEVVDASPQGGDANARKAHTILLPFFRGDVDVALEKASNRPFAWSQDPVVTPSASTEQGFWE